MSKKRQPVTPKPVPALITPIADAILTLPQFCAWAGVSRRQFYVLEAEGKIKAQRDGRRVKIHGADALAYRDAIFA